MNEEEFKECSVVAYPHEIRFLHIKGGCISYYVDRHISDYVNKLQKENEQLKQQLEQRYNIINKAREKIKLLGKFDGKTCTRGFQMWVADFNQLLEILNIDKGDE